MKVCVILVAAVLAILVFAACTRGPSAEPVVFDATEQRRIAEDSLTFLRAYIGEDTSFGQIVDAFAQLCAEPTEGEEILFEAGTYAFEGEPMFTVSLVRQIPDGEDEFFQIRAVASFLPDDDNRGITETIWIDPADDNAFSEMRRSTVFAYAETHPAESVKLRLDET